MKIFINTDDTVNDIEIAITCSRLTPELERIISLIRMMDKQLTGMKDGEIHFIEASLVLYIESVEKKTFIYTASEVFETNTKLYEFEEQLKQLDFFRASKASIINFRQITSLKADMNHRIMVTMSNGEHMIVSRQYADFIREKLGVK